MIKRPMKGVAVDDLQLIRLPCIAFPKIDGFRCILGQYPMTSRLSRFPNPYFHKEMSGLLKRHLLDSEVVVGKNRGPGVLQRTSSGLTSEAGQPDFCLWVFDAPMVAAGFEVRYDMAGDLVDRLNHPRVKLLKGKIINTYEELKAYLDRCLERKFEGIITRDLEGPWKDGKSTLREQWMLKVKPFDTAEGVVTGWYEEMENTNAAERLSTGKLKRSSAKAGKVAKGRLGGLILRDCKTGVPVRCGGGFKERDRIKLWELIQKDPEKVRGLLTRYSKQRMGEKDKPRHPNFVDFVDFRPPWDMAD